jgi:hypothetical protein
VLIFTVATVGLLLDHVTDLFVALSGSTVTARFLVFPTGSDDTGFVICTFDTDITGAAATFNAKLLLLLLPSADVAVMVVLPADMAVSKPVLIFTVATLGLLLAHVTAGFVALLGSTVTVRFLVFPTVSDETGLVI